MLHRSVHDVVSGKGSSANGVYNRLINASSLVLADPVGARLDSFGFDDLSFKHRKPESNVAQPYDPSVSS